MNVITRERADDVQYLAKCEGMYDDLFRWVHPKPACNTEEITKPGSADVFRRCTTHGVTSGPVLKDYISK